MSDILTICVCGGRVGVEEPRRVAAVLDQIVRKLLALPKFVGRRVRVIHGAASGYDTIADTWAKHRHHDVVPFKIDSELDGDKDDAPKRRNERMLEDGKPEITVGMPGGPGTRHMMDISYEAGVRVLDVEFTDDGGVEVYAWGPTDS